MTEDNYSKISRMAQKYTEDVPVIVLGTGATIPLGLPSMSDLAEQLVHHLRPETSDIGKWDEFKSDLEKTHDLEKSLHNIDISQSLLDMIVYETWEFLNKKDFQLSKNILTSSMKLPLTELLVPKQASSLRLVRGETAGFVGTYPPCSDQLTG